MFEMEGFMTQEGLWNHVGERRSSGKEERCQTKRVMPFESFRLCVKKVS